jgi:hypothetical protein
MHLDNIRNRIDKLSSDQIEGYLEVLQDQIYDTMDKVISETNASKKYELETLMESKQILYDNLFEQLREIRKSQGEAPPKYFGEFTIEQYERENHRMISLMAEYDNLFEKRRQLKE